MDRGTTDVICDVVVCYYQKPHLWPMVAHGLAVNKDHIGIVRVCNDERWDNAALQEMQNVVNGRFDCQFLWHEHEGFGAAKSINQGAAKVRTSHFLHIDDDIILREDCIKHLLEDADETTLVGGLCDDLDAVIVGDTMQTNPPPTVREDRRKWFTASIPQHYLDVRDCCLLCPTEAYQAIGGKDERYNGYGFIDYDFGIRWMMRYGLDSFQMGRGLAWNIGGLNKPHPWSPNNKALFDIKEAEWLAHLKREKLCGAN